MQRTIVVGDVHGCLRELEDILKESAWSRGENLILAGDLVAKGPDSAGVVALAREYGARAVLGNHDAHVLRLRAIDLGREPDDGKRAKPEHQQVLDTLSSKDFEYLESLPLLVNLGPEQSDPANPVPADTIVVHAGLAAGVALEAQERDNLLNMRSIREDGRITKKITGRPWAELWPGPQRVVFGHDAIRGLQQHRYATGLDTGCVYGRRLTALLLPERRLISVPARREYVSIEG
ncbi:MAG TPA: metallophosphoesterase [Polyangiaceae bacterium]|nr:metallophosphoesterase [Polyangiaceae bacterium]